ncbi:MAG: hypothetical protein ACYDDI_01515 [Candidatus Acidiferrales bacterium]
MPRGKFRKAIRSRAASYESQAYTPGVMAFGAIRDAIRLIASGDA